MIDFNLGWRFQKGALQGAEAPGFDDRSWRSVDLPHDWSVDDPEGAAAGVGPHDKDTPEPQAVGYLRGGTGWYRKAFTLDAKDAGKSVDIIFDGIQQDSDVWINGQHLGFQPHGYIGFHYDLTPFLKAPGEANQIVVRAINPDSNTRWYAGSGIYRQVSLRIHDPLNIPVWGLRIDTLWIKESQAQLQVQFDLCNARKTQEQISVALKLRGPKGELQQFDLGQVNLDSDSSERINQKVTVDAAQLWSPESPNLYEAELQLTQGGRVVDASRQNVGIRMVSVSAEKGFVINGQSVKLKGSCLHHDNGLLGAAAFAQAEYRRVAIMKRNGYNAIRTSHNPPSSAFLDACDRLGMLVIDEFVDMWELPKKTNGYNRYFSKHWEKDLSAMLARDFNHPSVVIWSIGNEIQERAKPAGVEIAKKLIACIRSVDSRRPITNAICGFWDNPEWDGQWDRTAAAFAVLDIGGYNYFWREYENDHAKFPQRVMAGTESYPLEAYENWRLVEKHPYVIGDFVWTGMDHIGESGIGHNDYISDSGTEKAPPAWGLAPWPTWLNWSGDIDLVGNKKPQSHYRDVVWGRSQVEIAVHAPVPAGKHEVVGAWGWPDELQSWNWPGCEGKTLDVNVYSRAQRVRLELNGRPLGERTIDPEKGITATFQVPYAPGTLRASTIVDGKVVATCTLETSGPAAALALQPELAGQSAERSQLIYVPIEIKDAAGRLVPDAHLPLELELSGPAEVQGFGSASPTAMGSLKDSKTDSFRGRALAILRSTGKSGTVRITLKSPGLPAAQCEITLPIAP